MLIFLSASELETEPVQGTAEALKAGGHRIVGDPSQTPDAVIAFDPAGASAASIALPGVPMAVYLAKGETLPRDLRSGKILRVLRSGARTLCQEGITVIVPPVDSAKYSWSWSLDSRRLIVPSALHHGAGHGTLFRALGTIEEEATAVVCGAEIDFTRSGIGKLAEKLGAGKRAELADVSSAVTACAGILPDLSGDTGTDAVLALMAKGIPVLASSSGVHRELVMDGITGLYHTPGNHAQLARQINHLMRDPGLCGYLSANAAARYEEAFSLENAGRRWTGVLEQLCSG